MVSGVRAKRRAAAAGMMSRDVMRRTPTTFIAIAMASAIKIRNMNSTLRVAIPSARARSSCSVAINSVRQIRADLRVDLLALLFGDILAVGTTDLLAIYGLAILGLVTLALI